MLDEKESDLIMEMQKSNSQRNSGENLNRTLEEHIFRAPIIGAQDACKYRFEVSHNFAHRISMIDGINSFERLVRDSYPKIKIIEIMKKTGLGSQSPKTSNSDHYID